MTTGCLYTSLVYNTIVVNKEIVMKRFVSIVALALTTSAYAGPGHYRGYYHGGHHQCGDGWVPWIGGAIVGAIIYEAVRPVPPPVVVYAPPARWAPGQPVIIHQHISGTAAWTPPAYDAYGRAYCPPGMALHVKQLPNGYFDNIGCVQ
jgi:hypothetical protein